VCGSLEAESLVRDLCKVTGDDFELVTYDRMTPLAVLPEPLGDYSKVQGCSRGGGLVDGLRGP
jgi:hypothetical protein